MRTFVLALASAASAFAFDGPAMDPAQWDGNHDQAMEAARRETRASVLYFAAPVDAVSHETLIRLKTDPVLVDAMDRMVRVILEQPDLGIAYGRYRVSELPALAVLDPGGALVDLVVITPHSDKWVGRFLDACEEAHARTAAWVRHPPPGIPCEHGPEDDHEKCRPKPRCAPSRSPARHVAARPGPGATMMKALAKARSGASSALKRYLARRDGIAPVEGAVELPQMTANSKRVSRTTADGVDATPGVVSSRRIFATTVDEVDASPGATRRTIEAAFAEVAHRPRAAHRPVRAGAR